MKKGYSNEGNKWNFLYSVSWPYDENNVFICDPEWPKYNRNLVNIFIVPGQLGKFLNNFIKSKFKCIYRIATSNVNSLIIPF